MSGAKSASNNIVGPMRRLGLFNEDGSLTERGQKWRTDGTYAEACDEILDEVYPDELGSLASQDGNPDAAEVRTWFDQKGFGESNARLTATYVMIAGKSPAGPSEAGRPKNPPKSSSGRVPKSKRSSTQKASEVDAPSLEGDVPQKPSTGHSRPNLHLDVQVHIAADVTIEQIDAIFASMAKHLYGASADG